MIHLYKSRFICLLTNHHPTAQTGPRPRPPMMEHTLLSSLPLRRMGKPCRAYRMMPYTRSKYTHQIETDVCAESSEPLSFVFTHFLYQIMQTLTEVKTHADKERHYTVLCGTISLPNRRQKINENLKLNDYPL